MAPSAVNKLLPRIDLFSSACHHKHHVVGTFNSLRTRTFEKPVRNSLTQEISKIFLLDQIVRPQVSLTAPNRDHFAPVSLMFFWMQLPKLKN